MKLSTTFAVALAAVAVTVLLSAALQARSDTLPRIPLLPPGAGAASAR